MPKDGDHAVMYCKKCKVRTPHTYKSSTMGDLAKKILNFKDLGSGWYCDNCGTKNTPPEYNSFNIEDLEGEDIIEDLDV